MFSYDSTTAELPDLSYWTLIESWDPTSLAQLQACNQDQNRHQYLATATSHAQGWGRWTGPIRLSTSVLARPDTQHRAPEQHWLWMSVNMMGNNIHHTIRLHDRMKTWKTSSPIVGLLLVNLGKWSCCFSCLKMLAKRVGTLGWQKTNGTDQANISKQKHEGVLRGIWTKQRVLVVINAWTMRSQPH